MAPIATTDLASRAPSEYRCSDPTVLPPEDADERLKELWTRHGDIHSLTYSNPELTSLPALVTYNARTQPRKIAYLRPVRDSFEQVTWEDFDAFTDTTAARYSRVFQEVIEAGNTNEQQPTIALLGQGNSYEYWAAQISLLKLGVRLLLLSDKNSDEATRHLLKTCVVRGIVAERRYADYAGRLGIPLVVLEQTPNCRLPEPASPATHAKFTAKDVWNQHAMVIHSSGSTGLPKPIIHTHRSMMLIARMYRLFQEFVVENWYLCFPLFHIAGVSIILAGLPTALPTTFPPGTWPPSPGKILAAWRTLEKLGLPVDCLHCAPAVIEDLYEYCSSLGGRDFSPLIRLKILQPGGAALSPTILKKLVDLGVNVKTTYGSTEIGPPFRTIPHTRNNPNCYHVRNLYPDNKLVRMEPLSDGLFECVVYKGFELAAELWLDPAAPNPYRTGDLLLEDPPGSGLFVLQGRKDDVLVHSNGEKTNALPLQLAIEESHEAIAKAAVFGTGKPCTSAVIQLQDGLSAVPQEALMQDVLYSAAHATKQFSAFSHLDESMILVLTHGEVLPTTPKGNVRRKEAEKMYKQRIDQLYEHLMDVPDTGGVSFTVADDADFVRTSVAHACKVQISDVKDTLDFYHLGLDSHKAVRLRSLLAKRFGRFPLLYIFEYPSVELLCRQLSQRMEGDQPAALVKQQHQAWIASTISRLSSEIKSWPQTLPAPATPCAAETGEVVYLTGATGSLGNALLAEFYDNPRVATVYCAIRGRNPGERLTKSLRNRGYPPQLCRSTKFVPVPYSMAEANLGFSDVTYQQLAREVSVVVHNAWKMDFNDPVERFEDDCLRGAMNLMRFAYTGNEKTFAFTSSVATCLGEGSRGRTVQESPIRNEPGLAMETGYAQSKFISKGFQSASLFDRPIGEFADDYLETVEVVAQSFARETGVPVRMFRVGQLCGHSTLGSWNKDEMFPIMIATGLDHLHAMPDLGSQQMVDWLPVDVCASAIASSLLSTSTSSSHLVPQDTYAVHNLVSPNPTSWSAFLANLSTASGQSIETLPMREWVTRLGESKTEGPGIRLLGFFENMSQAGEQGAAPRFETSVADRGRLGERLLRLYLERWRQEGFLRRS